MKNTGVEAVWVENHCFRAPLSNLFVTSGNRQFKCGECCCFKGVVIWPEKCVEFEKSKSNFYWSRNPIERIVHYKQWYKIKQNLFKANRNLFDVSFSWFALNYIWHVIVRTLNVVTCFPVNREWCHQRCSSEKDASSKLTETPFSYLWNRWKINQDLHMIKKKGKKHEHCRLLEF